MCPYVCPPGALRRGSAALRQRCEELQRLQSQRRAEREVLRGRAGQARALVEALRRERDEARRGRTVTGWGHWGPAGGRGDLLGALGTCWGHWGPAGG